MPVKLLNSENFGVFVARIEALRADSQRRWGALQPAGMVAHLNYATELSLGEIQGVDKSGFLARTIGKRFVFQTPIPWPKGKIKAPPEFTPETKRTLDEERARLLAAMQRFVETSEREPKRVTVHPIFGPFTLAYWQLAHGKHFNHHCEQFGV